jgi:hypothetical protein
MLTLTQLHCKLPASASNIQFDRFTTVGMADPTLVIRMLGKAQVRMEVKIDLFSRGGNVR